MPNKNIEKDKNDLLNYKRFIYMKILEAESEIKNGIPLLDAYIKKY